MSVGDLLSFIGIILAILAFLNEKERVFISIKFTRNEKYLLLVLFFLIVYLVLFDGFFYLLGWYVEGLIIDEGLEASLYAFLLSLSVVLFILLKIFVFQFPKRNTKKLIGFYEKLILRGDYVSVSDFIDRYHLKDICKYLEKRSEEFVEWSKENKPNYDYGAIHDFDDCKTKTRYSHISEKLIRDVFSKEHFILRTANYSPDTYCRIIQVFKFPSPFGRFIFKKFVESLILDKNVAINHSSGQAERWEDLKVKKTYKDFWDLLHDPVLIQCHAITRHLGTTGQKILESGGVNSVLNSKYDWRIHEGELQELEIMEIIFIFKTIGFTVIKNGIDHSKYKGHHFTDFFDRYADTILDKLDLPKAYTEYQRDYMNFGLAIIDEITRVLEHLLGSPTFLGNNARYIDEITECYLSILWAISLRSCPPDFVEGVYERLFKIYGFIDDVDKANPIPEEIRKSIRKNLTESAIAKLDYRGHKEQMKSQWAIFTPTYPEQVRDEFDLFLQTL